MENSNKAKYAAIFGIGILACGLVAWKFLKKSEETTPDTSDPDELTLEKAKILTEELRLEKI